MMKPKLLFFVVLLLHHLPSSYFNGVVDASPTAGLWAIKFKENADMRMMKKRNFVGRGEIEELALELEVVSHFTHLKDVTLWKPAGNSLKRSITDIETILKENDQIEWFELQVPKVRVKKNYFDDPLFSSQWHLENTGATGLPAGNDIAVIEVWKQGINGTNVVVAMVDDGLDHDHPDIFLNYNPEGSYDFNNDKSDPKPDVSSDNHGTRCAGEISAVHNNVCGVGVAFNSRISGIKLIAKNPTDADEAAALNYRMDLNHIYSNSWGPSDDGETVEGPGKLSSAAFVEGIKKGRNGLGSIYLFASGNGANAGDNCNFDGYVNSIYTLAIGAITDGNISPAYSEGCAALIAVTYSSGGKAAITTTDVNKLCTNLHSGTSAAAPIAAGLAALLLSYRPDLTWRDVQYLFIRSAQMVDPTHYDWTTNGAGLHVNHKYGFGKLNATSLIEAAKTWQNVGSWGKYSSGKLTPSQTLNKGANNPTQFTYFTNFNNSKLPYPLEHVTVTLTLEHTARSQVTIVLVSPIGTESVLAPKRPADKSRSGYSEWTFTTVRCWGEDGSGTWSLYIYDESNVNGGVLQSWEITLYGTGTFTTDGTSIVIGDYLYYIVGALAFLVSVSVMIAIFLNIRKRRPKFKRVSNNEGDDEDSEYSMVLIDGSDSEHSVKVELDTEEEDEGEGEFLEEDLVLQENQKKGKKANEKEQEKEK